MIKIITDSTAYIPKDFAEENNITVVPLKYLVDDVEYEEGFPDTFDECFERIESWGDIPKTSQPSLEMFIGVFEDEIKAGNEVICFTLSSSLSGTYSAAILAKNSSSDPSKIHVIDSGSTGPSVWGYIIETIEDIKKGMSCDEIVAHNTSLQKNSEIVFCPESFDNLKKGGRIGSVKAIIGTLLHIKPLLSFKKGVLTNTKNVMGTAKAISEIISMIPKNAKRIFIIKIYQNKYFEQLKEGISKAFPATEKIIADFGPVVGAHIGHAIGAAWICES